MRLTVRVFAQLPSKLQQARARRTKPVWLSVADPERRQPREQEDR
jgi:hypothetical protein